MTVEQVTYNRLTLTVINPRLVIITDDTGRYYVRTEGDEALESAKHLTGMYWNEVACFGSPVYQSDVTKQTEMQLDSKGREIEALQSQVEQLRLALARTHER